MLATEEKPGTIRDILSDEWWNETIRDAGIPAAGEATTDGGHQKALSHRESANEWFPKFPKSEGRASGIEVGAIRPAR